MKSDRQRIAELEATVTRLMGQLARVDTTPARPHVVPDGWWLGILKGELITGGTVNVRIWWWSDGKFRDSQKEVEAVDWYLAEGESVEAGTPVRIDWYRNTWVIGNIYCRLKDSEDVTATPIRWDDFVQPQSPFGGSFFGGSSSGPDLSPIFLGGFSNPFGYGFGSFGMHGVGYGFGFGGNGGGLFGKNQGDPIDDFGAPGLLFNLSPAGGQKFVNQFYPANWSNWTWGPNGWQ